MVLVHIMCLFLLYHFVLPFIYCLLNLKAVNRAARVAAQCEPGQVCVGVPMGDGEEPPDPGPSVDVDVLGVKQLKGISIEMAIFACKKRKEEKKSE